MLAGVDNIGPFVITLNCSSLITTTTDQLLSASDSQSTTSYLELKLTYCVFRLTRPPNVNGTGNG